MHELADTRNVLELAQQQAEAANASRITAAYLVLGELSDITEESVAFYWELLGAGTPAAGAALHFRRQLATWQCLDCATNGAGLAEACPTCGSVRLRVTGGREFYLEAIDVTADAPPAASITEPPGSTVPAGSTVPTGSTVPAGTTVPRGP